MRDELLGSVRGEGFDVVGFFGVYFVLALGVVRFVVGKRLLRGLVEGRVVRDEERGAVVRGTERGVVRPLERDEDG